MTELPFRLFWTWDFTLDWHVEARFVQDEKWSDTAYKKDAEDFLCDYRRLVDFSSANGFNGIIVYGLLRDSHGGVDAARELCAYANERGVRIIAGIGVHSYGGVYWEGDHAFNLPNWLRLHPDFAAKGRQPHQECFRMACPSREENRRWMKDAVQWLCETLPIGGINYETGDYGVCQCDECVAKSDRAGKWSMGDIVEQFPPLIEVADKVRSDILPVCECYFDNVLERDATDQLTGLPGHAILQFCINRKFWPRFQQEMTPERAALLPPHRTIIRTHMGSQWGNPEEVERHKFVAREFGALTKQVAEVGMQGVTVFGEVGVHHALHEINYLAVSRFADDPSLTWDAFVTDTLGPLLGGEEAARTYIALLEQSSHDDNAVRRMRTFCSGVPTPARDRWEWLLDSPVARRTRPIEAGNQGDLVEDA